MRTVYLNGQLLAEDQASISVFDRGFLLGDGIYEVIPCYAGMLFRLTEHLVRLQNNLNAVQLVNPLTDQEWSLLLQDLLVKNGGGDQSLYLQVTRGVAVRDHAFPDNVKPTVFVMSHPSERIDPEILITGVKAVCLADNRWLNCHLKTISLLPNVLLRQQAVEQGAAEAILIRDGYVTEGAVSNVFVVKQGSIMTPPKGPYLLPGITRDLILELAAKHQLPHEEKALAQAIVEEADEIWLTSSTKEVLPVTQLNGRPVGDGKPGPMWRKMHRHYADYKASFR